VSARSADLLTGLVLVALLLSVSLSAPRWARLFRAPVPVAAEEGAPPGEQAPSAGGAAPEVQRTISVRLFFESAQAPGLVLEDREVAFSPDLARQIRTVVEELAKGPRPESGLLATLPPEARVLDVFVSARGIAYLDLAQATRPLGEGSGEELRSVYSIVNTVTTNFPAVRRVQILIEDKPVPSLAGHVDLSRPLPPDMTLLAASTLTPREETLTP
jgi:hypothetical protein